ncbi:hypothetical protein DFP72DRAFT_863128 [Ephemerocybe angulata]|uniref:Uncharacterized protein n=1 Tax=Ephemerocybe angulata TaxID=980116 RepID=A0A8H6H7S6_9AGAR|nr:hypothetical protein DFP72DRAFT_863128 [Tulosesus angulatus]
MRLLHIIGDGTAYEQLPPTWIAMINKLMAYPLALLSIYFISGLPPSILEPLSNLHTLDLGEGVVLDRRAHELRNQAPPWCLQTLRCESMGIHALCLNADYPPSTYRGLRVIVIQYIESLDQHTAAWSFIVEASKVAALEVISLSYTDLGAHSPLEANILQCFQAKPFALSTIPSLRFLRVKVHHDPGVGALDSYLDVASFLPSFPLVSLQGAPQPSLEILDLDYGSWSFGQLTADNYASFSSLNRDYSDWTALDDVFSDKTLFPRLQALRISSKYRYYHEDNSDETNAAAKEIADKWGLETLAAMPKTAERIPLVDLWAPGYETVYATTGVNQYLLSLTPANDLNASFAAIAAHEQTLWERGVQLVGDDTVGLNRAPTISFVVVGQHAMQSKDIVKVFDAQGKAGIRWGHFYAYTLIGDLSPKLDINDGVVRIS